MDRRWSVDRGGPGPLTTGSMSGRGISRDVWATHCSDPDWVLKVKWTHFARPLYGQAYSSNWFQAMGSPLSLQINAYQKCATGEKVMWQNVAFHPNQLGKNPFEENKGYWVTQWLIIRPTSSCLSFEVGGRFQRSLLKASLTKAFDECTISLKQLPSPSWLFRGE